MKERNWTPGPWVAQRNPRFECLEVFSGRSRIADINDVSDVTFGPPKNEAIANAHLIAAAPDLYEALEDLWTWVHNWGPEFMDDDEFDRSTYEAALAKARGES